MKDGNKILEISSYEQGIIITALNDMRNGKLKEQKPTDIIDSVLLKAIDAPYKKKRVRNYEAR